MSCILQNYNKPPVMALAVPVAVKFLWHGNMELCRNMSSYLSLVAIAKADLLADHTEAITKSIFQGNYMLLRVLPSVYEKQPQSINARVPELVELMAQLDQPEQQHLLGLLQMVAKQHPQVLNKSLSSLISYLHDPSQNDSVLNILVEVSRSHPAAIASFLPNLKAVGEDFPNLLGQIVKIYGAVGLGNEKMFINSNNWLQSAGSVAFMYANWFSSNATVSYYKPVFADILVSRLLLVVHVAM
ncbi:UNVERIFIED_CONTAM: hypothetical protein FKN15_063063 [Acipenser sinensis]